MNRAQLLEKMRDCTRDATLAYYAYMHSDRKYVEGQNLHLREVHLLNLVGTQENIAITQIAKQMSISQGAASQIAGRLLKKGLIEKKKDPQDSRRYAIILTPSGRDAFDKYSEYSIGRSEQVDSNFDCFTDAELETIIQFEILVKKICDESK